MYESVMGGNRPVSAANGLTKNGLTRPHCIRIDAFQRRMMRSNVAKIKWPKKIENEDVYKTTKIEELVKTISDRRLRWFGQSNETT